MRAPYGWLTEFIDLAVPCDEVARILTMIGHEVEAIEDFSEDRVMVVNVTPNRPDCLSILGIARELSSVLQQPLKFPNVTISARPESLDVNVDILDPHLCPRYAGRIVKNLHIGTSPDWMRSRLEMCGIRSINNIVDVTNYVLLELGHPLHAFDLSLIKGKYVRIGTPGTIGGLTGKEFSPGEKTAFTTLDGVQRDIPAECLLIWDAEEPIAVAGVMGGLSSEVRETTKDIFIESAYFDPVSIRRTSRCLGLSTESSYRFERGTDIRLLKKALDRAAHLMFSVGRGTVYGKIDIYPRPYTPSEIPFRTSKINRLLGLSLDDKEITGILGRLEFTIRHQDGMHIAKPPFYRRDVQREADLAEEVARLHGYDRIPTTLPAVELGSHTGTLAVGESLIPPVAASLRTGGFTEVINYSFMSPEDIELLMLPENDERRRAVEVRNPLRSEDSLMRTMLAPSLLKNARHNVAYGNRELRLYEISKIFISGIDSSPDTQEKTTEALSALLPVEREHLGILLYREKTRSLYRDDAHDFFFFKGVLQSALSTTGIPEPVFKKTAEPFLHPGQGADIFVGGQRCGYIGVLHPFVTENLHFKAQNPSALIAEIDLGILLRVCRKSIKFTPLPRYPAIERDCSVVVGAETEGQAVLDAVRSFPSEYIEGSSIFDVYRGPNLPEGKKSVAFTVTYRAQDRTLTDTEIENLHRLLTDHVLSRVSGRIRS